MRPAQTPLALALLLPAAMMVAPTAAARAAQRPKVEVVFALDTTGSMGGLIASAKQKIWSIVNEIAEGRPSPDIRLGLIGYRDKGDAYVTTVTDLTRDLDAVYEQLMGFSADGGGDGPEHVNQALHDAVHKMSWSQDRRTLKVIFLVGDAPPHMDYQEDVKYQATCRQAVRKEIIINTIQCGGDTETKRVWQDVAYRSEGRYVAIAQSGGTVAVATPYDRELSELSARLDRTVVGYGAATEREATKTRVKRAAAMASSAAPEAAAARASYRAHSGAVAKGDLVSAVESGEVDLDGLAESQLPNELKDKSPAERRAIVAQKKAERDAIRKQIAEVSKKRDAYVEQELAKRGGAKDSFDAKVIDSIRAKAADKGISYAD